MSVEPNDSVVAAVDIIECVDVVDNEWGREWRQPRPKSVALREPLAVAEAYLKLRMRLGSLVQRNRERSVVECTEIVEILEGV